MNITAMFIFSIWVHKYPMTIITAEQALTFMLKNLSLSMIDHKFCKSIVAQAHITTNQIKLYKEIVKKYQKQFLKLKMNSDHISELKWEAPILESSPDIPYMYIDDGYIKFRAPFKREFIKHNAKFELAKWDKIEKVMVIPLDQTILKTFNLMVKSHYPDVQYCEQLSNQLRLMQEYSNLTWVPTLELVNGNYIVAAINDSLDTAISDTHVDDISNLVNLSRSGITVGDSILQNLSEYDKMLVTNHVISLDISDRDSIKKAICSSSSDSVYSAMLNRDHHAWIEPITQEYGIPYFQNNWSKFEDFKFPLLITDLHSTPLVHAFTKCILLLDSTPIPLHDKKM